MAQLHPEAEYQRGEVARIMTGLNHIAPVGDMNLVFGDRGTQVWLFEPRFDLTDREKVGQRLASMDRFLRAEGRFQGSYRIVFGTRPDGSSSLTEATEMLGYDMNPGQMPKVTGGL